MYLKEHTRLCVLYAIAPVHAGSGSSTGAVDLPIQRERHTGWPQIQASGVKGAFRDHCLRFWAHQDHDALQKAKDLTDRIFGAATGGSGDGQAGAVAFSDAKLLAFPVRSTAAPFVWVVCPTLLRRLARDLDLVPQEETSGLDLPCSGDKFIPVIGEFADQLVLEDLCLTKGQGDTGKIMAVFQKLAPKVDRLVAISDEFFSFLVETATDVQAQIKIDERTGITQVGSLRYEELLPADSVLYVLNFFGDERRVDNPWQIATVRDGVVKAVETHLQIGGDLSLGRGICQVTWIGN
ncbi:MAG: type III-B CRISPR module RAMP protein Cmr4 [Deltaproteobacteria bacterium RIFOXYD12_FULL_50_9]|nr:MAG: type III-B CRISPR module RAMP protein Cmr4 [Deltaproteobacteria bacterium RIFOXYD12_FULL_50_9]